MAVVTIDQAMLMRMMTDPSYVEMLPPLAVLLKKKGQRKTCCSGSTIGGATHIDRDTALREIGNMLTGSRELQDRLKTRLGADTLRVKHKKMGSSMVLIRKF